MEEADSGGQLLTPLGPAPTEGWGLIGPEIRGSHKEALWQRTLDSYLFENNNAIYLSLTVGASRSTVEAEAENLALDVEESFRVEARQEAPRMSTEAEPQLRLLLFACT